MKPRRTLAIFGGLLALALMAGACNFPGATPTPDLFATAAAQTVAAQLTQLPAETSQPALATDTPTPAQPAEATPTEAAGPTPTAGAAGCIDKASFVADVTIPDNTNMAPGETFTKTWRLRNSGTCTWTTQYALVFDSGNNMGGPAVVPMAGNVQPGGEVDLSVNLTAPNANGTYKGNWKLRNDKGIIFGIGASADKPFWVQIIVGPTATPKPVTTIAYDFVARYCDAQWVSGAGVLPCPGGQGDATGFVVKLDAPKLENGVTENEPALETHPEWVDNGVISGKFPAITVKDGDHFKAVIGCLYNGAACNVRFQLNYRADGGSLQNLGEWDQTYDGNIAKLDVDLSSLAGKSVEFVLAVMANGPADQDWAFWLAPRILRTQ